MDTPTAIEAVPHRLPDGLLDDDLSMWRYRTAIPVPSESIVSRGEGLTPLVPGPEGLLLKCDFISPSGSFKDRGASAMVSGLAERGVTTCFLDSSGNAGAAVALYAAAAGIECEVLVPATTPTAKTRQAEAHGARVIRIAGDREAVAVEARRRSADGGTYASHNWDPLFVHGIKTIAFELFEQCERRAPEHLVMPVGYGSSLLGCHMGFSELLRNGAIDRLPRMHAAQAEGCAPLHLAFTRGASDTAPLSALPTSASAIAASNPLRGAAMLAAIRQSGGQTVAVSEASIQQAQAALATTGFYVEPSGAVGYAAAQMLRATGTIHEDEAAVVLLTGSGLKI